jgi:hypothetical protein
MQTEKVADGCDRGTNRHGDRCCIRPSIAAFLKAALVRKNNTAGITSVNIPSFPY